MDATSRIIADIANERRAERRRWLYANDPLYRLSKLKANREDRELRRRLAAKRSQTDHQQVETR